MTDAVISHSPLSYITPMREVFYDEKESKKGAVHGLRPGHLRGRRHHGVRHFANPQEPVVLETVSDTLETVGAPSEDEKNANLELDVKAAVLIDADTGQGDL